MTEGEDRLRIDKWLWYARFFKSRTLASKVCESGRVRVNSTVIAKAKAQVKPDDVLTFPQGKDVRVIKIIRLGGRRGPASEAQSLYEDLSPPDQVRKETEIDAKTVKTAVRDMGAGRPTKKERREMDRFLNSSE